MVWYGIVWYRMVWYGKVCLIFEQKRQLHIPNSLKHFDVQYLKKNQYLPLNIYPFLIIKTRVAIMLYAMLMVCCGNL